MMIRSIAKTALKSSSRSFSAAASQAPATLPDLSYDYDALKVIGPETMTIHHTKHHQTYVNNLNAALEKYAEAEAKSDLASMIALQGAIKFNGGGHVNHTLFWENLQPHGGAGIDASAKLQAAVDAKFGSFDAMKSQFNAKAAAVQGSGWCHLAFDPAAKDLSIVTCANQDPCSTTGTIPLLSVDVWEHAYYLDYQNLRPKYLENIWEVINFSKVEERFLNASA